MATVKVCDVCGCPADETVFFVTGRSPDGAGSMSDDGYEFDLCWRHRSLAFEKALEEVPVMTPHGLSDFEKNEFVVDAIREMQNAGRK